MRVEEQPADKHPALFRDGDAVIARLDLARDAHLSGCQAASNLAFDDAVEVQPTVGMKGDIV
jgi:hypothetical protein